MWLLWAIDRIMYFMSACMTDSWVLSPREGDVGSWPAICPCDNGMCATVNQLSVPLTLFSMMVVVCRLFAHSSTAVQQRATRTLLASDSVKSAHFSSWSQSL